MAKCKGVEIKNSQSPLWLQRKSLYFAFFTSETKQWEKVECSGVPPSPRDKLTCVAKGTKIFFFGGFGPLEDAETEDQEGAAFGWFNDLFSFDTGMHINFVTVG